MPVNAVDVHIHMVLKAVSGALQLDGNNNNKEAYVSYLNCVQEVARLLLQDASTSEFRISVNTKKCIQLGQQCLERAAKLIDNASTGLQGVGLQRNAQELYDFKSLPLVATPTTPLYKQTTPTSPPHGYATPTKMMPDLPQLPSPTRVLQTDPMRSYEPSPLELAQRKNKQLMMAYRNRVSRLNGPSAANMSLSLQRKMAENMAIAQAREEAILRKMHERQQRLDQEAARRIVLTAGMSKDEQERRKIYTKVHMYEADTKWLTWRHQLTARPEDTKLIQELISAVLKTRDHPLTQLLTRLQYRIYDKIRPVVLSYIHELDHIRVPYVPSPIEHGPAEDNGKGELPNKSSSTGSTACSLPASQSPVVQAVSWTDISNERMQSPEAAKDMADILQNTKQTVEEAIKRGDRLEGQLRDQTTEAKKVLLTLGEHDHSQFDDLFDEDDGNDGMIKGGEEEPVGKADESYREMDITRDLANITDVEKLINLKDEALERHMLDIIRDVREALDKLQAMFIVAYELLDSAVGRDQCYASLEGPFFGPLWPYLMALCRLSNYPKEVQVAKAMTNGLLLKPADLGVRERFSPPPGGVAVPFAPAIDELYQLVQLVSPLAKLECIVRICRIVCQCVEDYSRQKGSSTSPALGADDLLPILSYVAIQSKLPQLVSECQAMEEFIHEGYLMAEEGYCLTSLQTALVFITSKQYMT